MELSEYFKNSLIVVPRFQQKIGVYPKNFQKKVVTPNQKGFDVSKDTTLIIDQMHTQISTDIEIIRKMSLAKRTIILQ